MGSEKTLHLNYFQDTPLLTKRNMPKYCCKPMSNYPVIYYGDSYLTHINTGS